VKGLDSQAHLVRSKRAILVVKGLVVAAITAGASQLLSNLFLTYQVPLWLILLSGVIGFFVGGATLRPRRKDQCSVQND
jgi:hypothetical protein